MVSSTPRSVRWCAMSATSPNHDGVEGTDWGEVSMLTAEGAMLLMKPPFEEILLFFFPFKETHFCAFYHPPSPTSLRNSWDGAHQVLPAHLWLPRPTFSVSLALSSGHWPDL